MKKTLKRLFCLVLALLMALSLSVAVFADDEKAEEEAKKDAALAALLEAQRLEAENKKKLDAAKTALAKAASDAKSAKDKKEVAEQQVAVLADEVALVEEQINITNNYISVVKQEEAVQYDLFCQQVRQEEERGSLSYWSVLFKASTFSDLLSRMDFVNEIMNYNNSVIASLQSTQEDLRETKAYLQEQYDELDRVQKEKEAAAAKYNDLYQEYRKTHEAAQAEYDMIVAEEAASAAAMKEAERVAAELGVTGGSAGGYIWPVKVSPIYITSKFGPRPRPTAGASTLHNGIDIGVNYVNCYAAKAGVVTLAGNNGGFGNCIIISHGEGYSTTYGHLSSIDVSVGDAVAQGDYIGKTGNSGVSTGPHLDFRIMENYAYKDPLTYLSGYTMYC